MTCPQSVENVIDHLNENGTSSIPCAVFKPELWRHPESNIDWPDFAHFEQEIRNFMFIHQISDRLPIRLELQSANRPDLLYYIGNHGGVKTIASRLGLKYMPPKKIVIMHWHEFQSVESGLRKFVEQHYLGNRMPLYRELRDAGMSDLSDQITKFGGYKYMAEWMGFRIVHRPKN